MTDEELLALVQAGYDAMWVAKGGYNEQVAIPRWVDLSDDELAFWLDFATAYNDELGVVSPSPIADAGVDQVVDADVLTADVDLDGSASDPGDGTAAYYIWLEDDEAIATGESPTVTLDIAEHTITLLFVNDAGVSDTDTVVITVSAP